MNAGYVLFSGLAALFTVEVIARLPLVDAIRRSTDVSRKVVRVIRSPRISEHWKEKVLLRYAGVMAGQSLRLSAYLAIIFAPIVVVAVIADQLLQTDVVAQSIRPAGIILLTAFGIAWGVIRNRLVWITHTS